MKQILLILVGVLCLACSPHSLEEFHLEGEGVAKEILNDLKGVTTAADLVERQIKLKRRITKLVDLMILAKKYQLAHPDEDLELSHATSEELKKEMMRIYQIEGCQEIFESIEREGLHKLDLFRNSLL